MKKSIVNNTQGPIKHKMLNTCSLKTNERPNFLSNTNFSFSLNNLMTNLTKLESTPAKPGKYRVVPHVKRVNYDVECKTNHESKI